MTSPKDLLYGVPGAEIMYTDPCTCYECDIEPDLIEATSYTIEEWTARPISWSIPSAERTIELVMEQVEDEYSGEDDLLSAAAIEACIPSFSAALQVLKSKIREWMQADRLVRLMTITFDEAGEPLLDGEPLYRKFVQDPLGNDAAD